MRNKIWFSAKRYGWGWYPSSWEGWVITISFAAIISSSVVYFQNIVTDSSNFGIKLGLYLVWVCLLVGVLMWICYKKGEKPKWRWG